MCVCVCVVKQGYVYSTFLKPYNPQRDSVHSERSDDFDNLSLFVSGSRRGSHSSYSASTPSSQQEDTPSTEEEEEQHVSHGFEVSVLEFDLVFVLQFITSCPVYVPPPRVVYLAVNMVDLRVASFSTRFSFPTFTYPCGSRRR